ncbi:hypothetical protein [Mycobacterium sp. MS1601]|uniref:hypothetical protein n=1 Tax=Mycobacterium sp. MS1601 TaxID=1936029 RepID=UPI00178C962E|nr:hypothetical protein [Mycobacterium sp. MS1601]
MIGITKTNEGAHPEHECRSGQRVLADVGVIELSLLVGGDGRSMPVAKNGRILQQRMAETISIDVVWAVKYTPLGLSKSRKRCAPAHRMLGA